MNSNFHIIPYAPEFEAALLELEKNAIQGSWIQLEIVRDHFLSRSLVFEDFRVFLAVTQAGELAGTTAGAIVPVQRNGSTFFVGLGYDLKVSESFRRQGLSKRLGKQLIEHYFLPTGAQDFFMTMKTSNVAVAKAGYSIDCEWYFYDFIYLTIPTWRKVKKKKIAVDNQRFKTKLLLNNLDLSNYFTKTESGLGIWETYRMYQIKLHKLHPFLKLGKKLGNVFLPKKRRIPGEDDLLKFATLFDFDYSNFFHINEVLEQLQEENIQYLNVCCQKGDFVWQILKPIAVNAYPYTLMGTLETKVEDEIAVDVRCL